MKQQQPIPETEGFEYCSYSICWPDTLEWRKLLLGFITQMNRGRFWDASTGSIQDVQAVGQEIIDRNYPLEECIVACSDLSDLASAIRSIGDSGCGCGSGDPCGGSGGVGPNDVEPSMECTVDLGQPPPEGFNDWNEFNTFKCDVATAILNQIIADLNALSTLQVTAITLLGLAPLITLLIATPIPGDAILVIAGVLLAVNTFGVTMVTNAANVLQNNFDDFLCALYDSTNTGVAQQLWTQEVNTHVDATHPSQPDNYFIKSLLESFNQASVFNQLAGPTYPTNLPTGDCSSCGTQAWWTCINGTTSNLTPTSVEIEAILAPDGQYLISIGNEMLIYNPSASQIGWSAPTSGPNFAHAYDQTEHLCGAGSGAPWQVQGPGFLGTFPSPMDTMLWRSGTPFTVTLTRTLTP